MTEAGFCGMVKRQASPRLNVMPSLCLRLRSIARSHTYDKQGHKGIKIISRSIDLRSFSSFFTTRESIKRYGNTGQKDIFKYPYIVAANQVGFPYYCL